MRRAWGRLVCWWLQQHRWLSNVPGNHEYLICGRCNGDFREHYRELWGSE